MFRRMAVLVPVSLLLLSLMARADIPRAINFQGKITDTQGAPLSGTYSLTFRIYDVDTGGTAKWYETHGSVPVAGGIFQVILGGISVLNLPFDQNYWLGVEVNTDGEMSPRTRLVSVGYAYRAAVADRAIIADQIVGGGPVPAGVIVMWHGSIASIPSGWALCDGNNGTPNLKDRFIVGASQDVGGVANTTVKGTPLVTGGEAQHTLTIPEMPKHSHSYRFWPGWYFSGSTERGAKGNEDDNRQTGETGGGQPHENCPPFYALAFIMKL